MLSSSFFIVSVAKVIAQWLTLQYQHHSMKVFLVGFMGSGKSFWARPVADKLGLPVIELDSEIEKETRLSISQVFDEKGEAWFRDKEANVLKRFSEGDFLMSCGGGAPCFFDNMKWMNSQGVTVWVNTSEEKIVKQLLPEIHKRPLLKGMNEKELGLFVKEKMKERIDFYRMADIIISSDRFDPDTLKENIELIHHLKYGS